MPQFFLRTCLALLSVPPSVPAQTSPAPLQVFDDASVGAVLAVGPSEIVTAHKSDLVVRDRHGTEVSRTEFNSWWQSIGGPWVGSWYEHTQFHFDPVYQRWYAAAHESHAGDVFIAVSRTPAFVGAWSVFTFNDAFVKGPEAADLDYADYCTPHLGFGGGLVALTLLLDDHPGRNVFHYEDDSGYVILALGDLQGGGDAPITARTYRIFHETQPYEDPWPIPARTLSDASGLYFLALLDPGAATYGLSKLSLAGSDFFFFKNYYTFARPNLASAGGYITAIQPQTSVQLVHEDELGDVGSYGSSVALIPARRHIRDVIVRDDHLWAVHEGKNVEDAVVRTHWLQLKLSNPKAVIQSARIGGGGDSLSCLAPSLGVNAAHDVMVGFTATGPHHFPSAGYVVRLGGDTPGTMRAMQLYAPGNNSRPSGDLPSLENFAFWPSRSLTAVDGFDDVGFWTSQSLMLQGSGNPVASTARVFGNIPPTITDHPDSKVVPPQGAASFTVVAGGTDLHYQWFHNDEPLPGAVSSSVNVVNVNALRTGYYRCRVHNAGGEVWSNEAVLSLTTGNPGVFSFVDGTGADIDTAGYNEEPPRLQGIPLPRNLVVRRRNGTDGRVRVRVEIHGRLDPPAFPATESWDYHGIQAPPIHSRFFSGPGALVFEPGETQKLIPLNIRDDTMVEGLPETFEATLAPDVATGAATTTPRLEAVIIDDDFEPNFQAALDSTLTFTNVGSRWKAQTSETSDGVDAAQSDVTGFAEASVFGTTLEGTGTLAFRWRSDGDPADALRLITSTQSAGEVTAASISGQTAWRTVALAVTDPGRGDTGAEWRFVRGARSTNPLATGFVDKVIFHSGTGGLVEFENPEWSTEEAAGPLTLTLRRRGHTAAAGSVAVSLQSISAESGVDFQPLPLSVINFAAGVTTRTFEVNVLPDGVTEPPETLRAVLFPVGGGTIGIGPIDAATISILDQPGETFDTWANAVFTPAQLANASISGRLADPDNDRLPNLLEYALDGHPTIPNTAPLPRSSVEVVFGEEIRRHLFQFSRRRRATDLTYIVQRSADGVSWQDGATISPAETTNVPSLVQLVSAAGSPIELRIVRDASPIAAGTRGWLRLKVTSP
jgi:hypothetical protein